MKNARSPFLPNFVPRFLAISCVMLLVGALSLASILGIALLGPALDHGGNVSHAAGLIEAPVGPGKDFVLQTMSGQLLHFQCGEGCRASLAHLQRHFSERAHTDVYYVEGAHQALIALDVD
ncbi:MAG TPA: hypothetical protein VGD98_17745 [Ktedonobacteraceae bacterium]